MANTNQTDGSGNVDKWIEQLLRCEPLSEEDVKTLCKMVSYELITFIFI